MLFSDFICLPPSTGKHVHAHTNAQIQVLKRASIGCTSLAVSRFELKKSWRIPIPPKSLYQVLGAEKNTQYHLPEGAPEKCD